MSDRTGIYDATLLSAQAHRDLRATGRFSPVMMTLAGVLLCLLCARPTPVQAATIPVDGTDCSLINAITAANTDAATGGCTAGSGADTLVLASDSIHTLTAINNAGADGFNNGLPQITTEITIDGNHATIIRPLATSVGFRIFYVTSTGVLTLNNLTVQGGSIQGNGGGIANVGGNVTLNQVSLISNASKRTTGSGGGGGLYSSGGTVALSNSLVQGSLGGNINVAGGTLMISSSTIFSGIDTGEGTSGGIFVAGTLVTIDNSTITGNASSTNNTTNKGGGITVTSNGSVTINDSTITGNSTINRGGAISVNGAGGAVVLGRSLIAGNSATSGHELYNNGGAVTADSANLFGHSGRTTAAALSGFTPGASDRTATSDGTHPAVLSAILDTTPASNGAPSGYPVLTHALVADSPALDVAASGPATDHAGCTRPQGSAYDIGAFELEQSPPQATITIVLETVPKLPTNLGFNGSLGAFLLDDPTLDDGDIYTNTRTFTVTPGSYTVRRNNPTDWFTTAITCTPTANAVITLAQRSALLTVADGEHVTCVYTVERAVFIHARPFNDLVRRNTNLGKRNAADPWLEGWTMTLSTAPTNTVASQVTVPVGSVMQARFASLHAGTYTVCVTLPDERWIATEPASFDPLYGQPCKSVTLTAGQIAILLFGAYQPSVTTREDVTFQEETVTDVDIIMNEPAIEEEGLSPDAGRLRFFLPWVQGVTQ